MDGLPKRRGRDSQLRQRTQCSITTLVYEYACICTWIYYTCTYTTRTIVLLCFYVCKLHKAVHRELPTTMRQRQSPGTMLVLNSTDFDDFWPLHVHRALLDNDSRMHYVIIGREYIYNSGPT